MNSSVEEFLFVRGDPRKELQEKQLQRFVEAVEKENMEELIELEKALRAQSIQTYSFDYFLLYAIDLSFSGRNHEDFQTQPLLTYLMQVENWGERELRLFSTFAFALEADTTYSLMKQAIKRSERYQAIPKNRTLMYRMLLNLFSAFFFKREWAYAEEIVSLYEKKFAPLNDSIEVYLKMVFNRGLLHLSTDSQEEGIKKCQEAIHECDTFQKMELKMELEKRLAYWIENVGREDAKDLSLDIEW